MDKDRRKIGGFRRLRAFADGICEVCMEREITMLTGCRRSRVRVLGVCDECGVDFHNSVPVSGCTFCMIATS